MPRQAAQPRGAPHDWLALGPASRIVGVDPDTMRRWADSGRVHAFTTPGGHRRFSREDLERLVARKRPGARPLAELGATPGRLTRAYARAYREGGPVAADRMEADARAAQRADGRRLVAVLLAFLDATRPADRDRWEGEALALIGFAGRRLAEAGADTMEVLSVYLRARKPLLDELAAVGKRRSLDPTEFAALYDKACGLLDRLLLHLVETHAALSAAHEFPED